MTTADMSTVEHGLAKALRAIRRAAITNRKLDEHMCAVETFCAISLTLMKRSTPEDVRDAARTVEIKARLDGVEILREAA